MSGMMGGSIPADPTIATLRLLADPQAYAAKLDELVKARTQSLAAQAEQAKNRAALEAQAKTIAQQTADLVAREAALAKTKAEVEARERDAAALNRLAKIAMSDATEQSKAHGVEKDLLEARKAEVAKRESAAAIREAAAAKREADAAALKNEYQAKLDNLRKLTA